MEPSQMRKGRNHCLMWNFIHCGCRFSNATPCTFKHNHGLPSFAESATNCRTSISGAVLQAAWFCYSPSSCMMMSVPSRSLGGTSGSKNYSRQEQHLQQVLAVASSSISVLSALISFYWFAHMKRNFRHQYVAAMRSLKKFGLLITHRLIMLLIASGMFKALWYWIPPITILALREPISHSFCQGAGFLLAVGIEASGPLQRIIPLPLAEMIGPDSVILLMAIHTALTIFASRKANSQTGLYHYRWVAYTCWAFFSILMAALAFINPSSSYVSQGTFCYLPARPIWYRLALSWIPRYIILCTILGIYLAVYLYTRSKFGNFDVRFSTNSLASEHTTRTDRQSSWPLPGLDGPDDPEGAEPDTEMSSPVLASPIASQTAKAAEISLSRCYEPVSGPPARPVNRTPTLLEALRDKTLVAAANRRVEYSANAALRQQHKAIKRQLRYLFVYPLVYLAMWIPAFVNHCYLC